MFEINFHLWILEYENDFSKFSQIDKEAEELSKTFETCNNQLLESNLTKDTTNNDESKVLRDIILFIFHILSYNL